MARRSKTAVTKEDPFVYFKGVEGRVVFRYGTTAPISHTLDKKVGYVFTGQPTRIPVKEELKFRREYTNCLKRGDLKKSDAVEFEQWEQEQAKRAKVAAKKLKEQREAAKTHTEAGRKELDADTSEDSET